MAKVLDLRSPLATQRQRRPADYLETSVDDYLDAKRRGVGPKGKPCSPSTLDGYAFALRKVLLPYMHERELSSWRDLDDAEVALLRERIFDRPSLRPASANTYMRHINYFLTWLHREGEQLERIQARQIPEQSRAALVISDDELTRVERLATNERDRLAIRILADTGVRVSELATLRYDRIHRGSQLLAVLEKGGQGLREREVPLVVPGVIRRLERYIEDTGGRTPDQPYVFIARRRDPLSKELEPLQVGGFQKMLRNLGRQAGLEKPLTPHILRHTFITKAIRIGVPDVVIARIVGHRDLRMIQKHYDRTNAEDAAKILAEALARDRRRA